MNITRRSGALVLAVTMALSMVLSNQSLPQLQHIIYMPVFTQESGGSSGVNFGVGATGAEAERLATDQSLWEDALISTCHDWGAIVDRCADMNIEKYLPQQYCIGDSWLYHLRERVGADYGGLILGENEPHHFGEQCIATIEQLVDSYESRVAAFPLMKENGQVGSFCPAPGLWRWNKFHQFQEEYHSRHGEWAQIDFWCFHLYPEFGNYSGDWRRQLDDLHDFLVTLEQYGPVRFVVKEIGTWGATGEVWTPWKYNQFDQQLRALLDEFDNLHAVFFFSSHIYQDGKWSSLVDDDLQPTRYYTIYRDIIREYKFPEAYPGP